MKKIFENPEVQVISFGEDVITASGIIPGENETPVIPFDI